MGRNKEDNDSFRVRMDSAKREYLAGEIISLKEEKEVA